MSEAGIKIELSVGASKSKLSSEYKANAVKGSSLNGGGSYSMAAAAVTGVLGGLGASNLGAAAAGGMAPYIANKIKHATSKFVDGHEQTNVLANTMAHAVAGAVLAQLAGNSASAGAAGAAGGELMARAILSTMYPGKKASELTEDQKQVVSALGQLAAGLAGGLATGDTARAATGAQAGKNAVENNYLSSTEARALDKEMQDCKASGGDCNKVAEKYIAISNENSKELQEACTGGGVTCLSWEELVQAATNVALNADKHQVRLDEKLKDPDAAAIVKYLNGSDLKFLKENITNGDRVMDVIMTPTSWPVAIMGWKAIITNAMNNTKEQLIAVGVGMSAGAGIQYGTTGEVKLSDVIGSGLIGAITAGKGYNPTMAWNAAGGYYQAEISGDDPFIATMLSKAGSTVGYATGNVIKVPMDKILNPVTKQYEWVPTGVWTITKPVSQHPLPSVVGNIGGSVASGLVPGYLEKTETKK